MILWHSERQVIQQTYTPEVQSNTAHHSEHARNIDS
jgi:hypothetical protein